MAWPTSTTVVPVDGVAAASREHWELHRATGAEGHRLTVLQAVDHRDATKAIAMVRRNQVVLINCSALERQQAQRLIDIVSGGVLAMDGQVRQLSPQVVLACSALTVLQVESVGDSRGHRRQRR